MCRIRSCIAGPYEKSSWICLFKQTRIPRTSISASVRKKFFWCLNEQLVTLEFFEETVSLAVKRKMATAVKKSSVRSGSQVGEMVDFKMQELDEFMERIESLRFCYFEDCPVVNM